MARSLCAGIALLLIASGCKTIDPAFKGGSNKKVVYIIGETKLGDVTVPYEPGMTVRDVVAQRGGITTRGVPFSVRVYRPAENKTLSCKINYDKVATGNFRENILLEGGDIVYVPKTFTTVLYDGFKALFPPWNDMVGTGTLFMQTYSADKAAK